MTLKNCKSFFIEQLKNNYSEKEAEVLFFIVLEKVTQKNKLYFLINSEEKISEENQQKIEYYLKKLQENCPIQYLTNEVSFFGLPFFVDENVLIPRQETEELVAKILENFPSQASIKILDIGTGSGCIAVSLAKYLPESQVFAIDVSEKALEVAQRNATENKVQIQFLKKNILEIENLPFEFDVIVSNPPYVRELEKVEIQPNVLCFEPHLALFVPDEKPLVFYEKIAELFKNQTNKKGVLFFEINQYLAKEMIQMLQNKGFNEIELFRDLQGNDRIMKIKK